MYGIVKYRHGFCWRDSTLKIALYGTAIVVAAFSTTFVPSLTWRYALGSVVLIVATSLSLIGLMQRLGFKNVGTLLASFRRQTPDTRVV